MLSFGIRFGQGFDRNNIIKLMRSIPVQYDYDLIVIGCNAGGVACAREAGLAGKKAAIVRWREILTADDESGENVEDVEEGYYTPSYVSNSTSANQFQVKMRLKSSSAKSSTNNIKAGVGGAMPPDKVSFKSTKWSRKIRLSKLDLNNSLLNRGHEGRKLMHNASIMHESVEGALSSGWRIPPIPKNITINWNKMIDLVTDYVMEENWKLMKCLSDERVEVIEGIPSFVDSHTIKITTGGTGSMQITTRTVCLAPAGECQLPVDIPGAQEYGITCDDFIRLSDPPGRTLVVGSQLEGLECAGILACCRFPVVVVTRSNILKGYDTEMAKMIVENLKSKDVIFMENTLLQSIELRGDKLLTKFAKVPPKGERRSVKLEEEEFDTVIFAVRASFPAESINLTDIKIDIDSVNHQIRVDERDNTVISNIYAIGEIVAGRPNSVEISAVAGRLLGRRLYQSATELMNYTMYPTVLYTPIEYAFVGMSEDAATHRLGTTCVDVYRGFFKPLEFVVPPKVSQCFGKIVVFKNTDAVVGMHLYGPGAAEVIQGFAALIRFGVTMTKLRGVVGIYGTKANEMLQLKGLSTSIGKDDKRKQSEA